MLFAFAAAATFGAGGVSAGRDASPLSKIQHVVVVYVELELTRSC
jgi:hypothetical protein